MTISPKDYQRNTFTVKAIRITAENIREVAEWSHAKVMHSSEIDWWDRRKEGFFLRLPGSKDLKSFGVVGDWVLRMGYNSYRVYSDQSFRGSFNEAKPVSRAEVLELVKQAMLKQDTATYHGESSSTGDVANETANAIMKLIRESNA